MIRNKSFHNKNASSEIVGGLILIVIAVLAFSVIRVYLFPDLEPVDINIKLEGYVTDRGAAVVEHVGGEQISDYKVLVSSTNGALIVTKIYRDLIPEWSIGQCIYPLEDIGYPPLILKTDKVEVMIYICQMGFA